MLAFHDSLIIIIDPLIFLTTWNCRNSVATSWSSKCPIFRHSSQSWFNHHFAHQNQWFRLRFPKGFLNILYDCSIKLCPISCLYLKVILDRQKFPDHDVFQIFSKYLPDRYFAWPIFWFHLRGVIYSTYFYMKHFYFFVQFQPWFASFAHGIEPCGISMLGMTSGL